MGNDKAQLVEQHIRAYQSRLKRIDELWEQAQEKATTQPCNAKDDAELSIYKKQRELLRQKTDEIKTIHIDNWRDETLQSAGPMAVWDIVAQSLEDFIERRE